MFFARNICRVCGGLLAILTLLSLVPFANAAKTPALVHPDPLTVGLKQSETRTISIRVENAQELYGVELHLEFDPKIVQVRDTDASAKGVQIQNGEWIADGFVAENKADNKRGTIDYAITLLNPAPALNGEGVVASIQFEAVDDGTSPFAARKVILATRDAQEIESEWQDGVLSVSATGQAPKAQANQNTNQKSNARGTASQANALSSNLILLGAAGFGVMAFVGALGLLFVVVIWRRRSRYS